MDNETNNVTVEEIQTTEASNKSQRLRKLLRQNSERLGNLAEDVILPIDRRSLKSQPSKPSVQVEVIALDVESQNITQIPVTRTPIKKFPIFMVLISCLQVVLFYYYMRWLALCYDPHRRHEIWRFLTIMLVHSSPLHLWSNVIFQLILGVLLEIVHHWKRIAIIYLASVLGGTLFISVISPKVYGVGASGGVYGLLFTHLATIILNWNQMERKCCRVFWLLAYIAFDFGLAAYVEFGMKIETNTSHAGHLGGAVTGFLTSTIVLKNFEKHPWEKVMQKICAGILVALAVLIILTNIFGSFLNFYSESEYNVDYERSLMLHVYEQIEDSPPGSDIRMLCDNDPDCKEGLEQYRNTKIVSC